MTSDPYQPPIWKALLYAAVLWAVAVAEIVKRRTR